MRRRAMTGRKGGARMMSVGGRQQAGPRRPGRALPMAYRPEERSAMGGSSVGRLLGLGQLRRQRAVLGEAYGMVKGNPGLPVVVWGCLAGTLARLALRGMLSDVVVVLVTLLTCLVYLWRVGEMGALLSALAIEREALRRGEVPARLAGPRRAWLLELVRRVLRARPVVVPVPVRDDAQTARPQDRRRR